MTSLATWIEPVYHQAVLNGNLNYFHDFNCTFPSANICGEVVTKSERERAKLFSEVLLSVNMLGISVTVIDRVLRRKTCGLFSMPLIKST